MPNQNKEVLAKSFVPEAWKQRLIRQDWCAVLLPSESEDFGEKIRPLNRIVRSNGGYDIVGVWREDLLPVWVTGVEDVMGRCQGIINFGGRSRGRMDVPSIGFTMIPNRMFDRGALDWALDEMEKMFPVMPNDSELKKAIYQEWASWLNPISRAIETADKGKDVVIFTGERASAAYIRYLGVKNFDLGNRAAGWVAKEAYDLLGLTNTPTGRVVFDEIKLRPKRHLEPEIRKLP